MSNHHWGICRAKKVFLDTLTVTRGEVYTEIAFNVVTGKSVTIKVVTTNYLLNTAKDANSVLTLVGKKVPEPKLDIDTLRKLPSGDPQRTAALAEVKAWLGAVTVQTKSLLKGLKDDVIKHTPQAEIDAYNKLVASQETEWGTFLPEIAKALAAAPKEAGVVGC